MAGVVSQSRTVANRLLTYCTNLKKFRYAIVNVRPYSEFESNDEARAPITLQEESNTVWPDDLMGPLSPQNKKFPLPGNIGASTAHIADKNKTYIPPNDALETSSNSDRQLTIISQLLSESDYLDEDRDMSSENNEVANTIICKYFEGATVELAIQDSPKILYKDFASLFLGMPKSNLTVITITQKTSNDMSGWSNEVEVEREELLENFITTATEVCQLLKAHGFWCDFIDPSSGQPFFGQHTNTTMFETDERYNSLGFRIEDLGCCKVITHKQWGSKVFVGSIVTTADKWNPVMKTLLKSSTE